MNDYEELMDGDRREQNGPIFRKDRHLSSALLITEIEYMFAYRDNPRALKREHRDLLNDIAESGDSVTHPQLFYSWMMKKVLAEGKVCNQNSQECRALLRIAQGCQELATYDWTHRNAASTTHLAPTEILLKLYDRKVQMDDVFDKITYSPVSSKTWSMYGVRGKTYGNLHTVRHREDRVFVITHSHLAGIRDMVSAWFDVVLYAYLYRDKYEGHDLYKEVFGCVQMGSSYAQEYPVEVYVLMKMWPSICIGTVLRDTEGYSVFYDALAKDIPHKQHPFVQWMIRPKTTDVDVHIALEISGLGKIFGHPIIDMEASINSWIEKGTVMKPNKQAMGIRCSNMLKLVLCRRYYEERHRWPPLRLSGQEAPHIRHNYKRGIWEETQENQWLSSDFKGIRFLPTFEFNMYVDPSDLLSDKSIIPSRHHWCYEFDPQAHRTLYGKFMIRPSPQSKSVIISYLSQEEVNVGDIINTINRGTVPLSWKVIIAVAKEREHKRDNARFYAKMTPEMRLYQIATEGNIADTIFKYIKEQSMTMGEEQLLRTITRMTSPQTDPTKSRYKFIVIDFSSWCTNFRWELSQGVFRDLDDLFGFDMIYQYTHIFHLTSLLMFQDRFGPPQQSINNTDPVPGKRCVYGPEAWQEGLRQKGWTLITIMLIQLAAETCNTTASLLGQGDNQVVLLRIPPDVVLRRTGTDAAGYVDKFVTVLSEYADQAGILIKPLETWQSNNLFEYSRRYHYKGAQISCALKKISRLASEANQVIPTLNGDISGLYSTGASASSEDITPRCAYQTTIVEAAHMIRRAMPWLRKRSDGYSMVLVTNTRTLGGFPVSSYPNFCMRAVQDPLPTSLHWLRTLMTSTLAEEAAMTLVSIRQKSTPDYETLIKDPTSLPVVAPLQSEHFLRDMVKQYLPNLIKNKSVKNLFDFNADTQKTHLIGDLTRMKPFNPRLANKLYSLSNFGLQEKYISKSSGTRSIQQATLGAWTSETDVLDSVKSVEKMTSDVLMSRQVNLSLRAMLFGTPGCMTTLAQNLRDTMWGIELEGITMAAQQEQTGIYRWEDVPLKWAPYTILYIVDPSIRDKCHITRGEHTPYYGSATKMRVRRAPMQIMEVGNIVSSLKQLMEIRGWVKGDDNVTKLVDHLIAEKTSVPLETLLLYTRQVYSGAISHRLPCQALKRGGMTNQCLNFSSHIHIISDTALHYAKSGTNYTICFQSAFLYGLSVLAHLHEMGQDITGKWGLVFHKPCCVQEIHPESFELDGVRYTGVDLVDKLEAVRPKYELTRIQTEAHIDGSESYSIIMARKFVLWIQNIRLSSRISSLENRAIHESLSAPFVNLTEFVHLNCKQFFFSFIYYTIIHDKSCREDLSRLWEPIMASPLHKTSYDVLIDSLVKCGLLGPWADITGMHFVSGTSRAMLRCLLSQTLSHLCRSGWMPIVLEHSILTPEDSDRVHVTASHLLHKAKGVFWPHLSCPSYETVKQTVTESRRDQGLLARHTTSEEEAVCCVRAERAPRHRDKIPSDNVPPVTIQREWTADAFSPPVEQDCRVYRLLGD